MIDYQILDQGKLEDVCAANILFKETCYDDDMQKYRLICLDTCLEDPMQTNAATKNNSKKFGDATELINTPDCEANQPNSVRLSSVRGCMDFIYYELGGQNLLRTIEQLAHDFEQRQWLGKRLNKATRCKISRGILKYYLTIFNKMYYLPLFYSFFCVFSQANFIHELQVTFKCAIEEANKYPQVTAALEGRNSERYHDDMCLAIETYLLHLLHLPILSYLSIMYANDDAGLNRNIRYIIN